MLVAVFEGMNWKPMYCYMRQGSGEDAVLDRAGASGIDSGSDPLDHGVCLE